jgi:hypothetical protein
VGGWVRFHPTFFSFGSFVLFHSLHSGAGELVFSMSIHILDFFSLSVGGMECIPCALILQPEGDVSSNSATALFLLFFTWIGIWDWGVV